MVDELGNAVGEVNDHDATAVHSRDVEPYLLGPTSVEIVACLVGAMWWAALPQVEGIRNPPRERVYRTPCEEQIEELDAAIVPVVARIAILRFWVVAHSVQTN